MKQANGRADDAEKPPPHTTYSSDAARAEDNQTFSGSHAITWNYLGGYVHAVPGDTPNENEDAATATSFSKAQTELVVSKAGNYTLTTDIELSGLQIIGEANVSSAVMVTIRDTRNRPLSDANGNPLAGTTFQGQAAFSNDANGTLQVNPAGGTLANSRFTHSYSTPRNGVALGVGTYWVQMELNLIANAKASWQAPGPKPEAHLDTAKLKLSVH